MPDPADTRSFWLCCAESLATVGKPLLLGAAVFAWGFGWLAYGLVNSFWRWQVQRKRRGRRQGRDVLARAR